MSLRQRIKCYWGYHPKDYVWYRNENGHLRAKCRACGHNPIAIYVDSREWNGK